MTNAENGKKYSIIAAICFAVLAVYYVISDIVYYSGNEYSSLSFLDILSWSIAIGFAVTLFLKNKFAVTIVAGIYALLHVYYIVRYFSLYNFLGFLAILLSFLAIVAVGVILALSLKNNQITKKIWFIGAALLFVGTLMLWIQGRYFEYISVAWKAMLSALVEIVAFLFVGLWVKESITSGQTAPVNEYATFNPQTYSNQTASNDAIGGADKLKMYKELLDSGTITQEEFDAKKKQILGLYRGLIIEKENIIIKGTPKKNKVALIILLSGIAVAVISFIVASYYFNNVDGYEYYGFGYGGWYTYRVIYDFDFFDFYFSEFFGSCIHGYMLIAGIIAIIVGLIMKFNTEKCEITVTNNRILGKLAHGKEVNKSSPNLCVNCFRYNMQEAA